MGQVGQPHQHRRLVVGALLALLLTHVAHANAQDQPKVEVVPVISHSQAITSVAFSPDGARLVSGSADKTLKLWDVATGQLLRTFQGHNASVSSVAFSPDGARLVSGSGDSTLKVWDGVTGQLLQTFEGHSAAVYSVAFSPDGARLLSGSDDSTVNVWDAATTRLMRTLGQGSSTAFSVAFSPDGTRVLSGNAINSLELRDATTGQLLQTFEGHTDWVTSVAFSPDGKRLLSGSNDETLKLWDATTGQLLRTLEGHSGNVRSVAFSPDGERLLSGSGDRTLKMWDGVTGQLLRTLEGHSAAVYSVAFSPDGAHLLSGGGDKTLKVWDATTGQLLRTLEGQSATVASVAFSRDGTRLLSGSFDNTLKLWDAATGQILRALEGHTASVSSVAFSPDGKRLLSGSWDNTLKLWDAATGQLLRTFEGHSSRVYSVAFSPDGARLLSGSDDRTLKVWDGVTGHLLRTLEGHASAVYSVAFSPDGARLLSGSFDNTLKLWDAATGQLLRTLEGHSSPVYSVAFSPDGAHVLSGGGGWDNTLKLWDAASGQLLRTLEGHSSAVYSVAFSPDGKRLLSGSWDNTVKLWDATMGHLLRTLEGHSSRVYSVAFSPDGARLLSGSDDTTVRIWNPSTLQALISLFAGSDGAWMAITPDGFFSASRKGTQMVGIARGLEVTTIDQVHQSLYNPDLVREALAGDPDSEVAKAAGVINLEKVLDSGPAPEVKITSHGQGKFDVDLVTVSARINDRGEGIGRIEWRVNGITSGICRAPACLGPNNEVKQQLALDPGENTIEVVAYNARDLLASLPARTTVTFMGPADKVKPKLHVLAIGINNYVDRGWVAPGDRAPSLFPKLKLAVGDAKAIGAELRKAGAGLYGRVRVRTVLDGEATAAKLDAIMTGFAAGINPRDTFVLFAAAHGYSHDGRFYLIPQDYQGGPNPEALKARAIGQVTLQDWIANRVKAKKTLILLDTCESGALTSGYLRSRVDGPASDASIGRLHEATGRPVLTAAAQGQSAFEFQDIRHGIFTAALIDGLRRAPVNQDGAIMLSSLVSYVQDLVPKLVKDPKERAALLKRGPAGGEQSVRFGSRGEDFAVVRPLQ